jgi:aspartate carbamoyltransferase regulatory subunit
MEKKNENRKELVVSAIENGTVIDHIPVHSVFQVIRLLGLDTISDQVLFGTNLDSKKFGKKGIIKVNNQYFAKDDINKIALVAPTATLIEIRGFQVIEKKQVEVPDHVEKVVKCVNPNCVTNIENVVTKFRVINKNEVKLRCHYCEKITDKRNMGFR